MSTEVNQRNAYKVWAVDDVVYGPVDISTLTQWVKEERILHNTWIFSVASEKWAKAGTVPELSAHFAAPAKHATNAGASSSASDKALLISGLKPGMLRRVKVFAEMTDQQLGRFVQMMEVIQVPAFKEFIKKESTAEAMYAVLEGELRARLMVGTKESTLATYQAGDIFGEMCLFDEGVRSADVLTHTDCRLLKISATRFKEMCQSHPELSVPLLIALGRTLSGRMRNDNRRLSELVSLSRAAK
ncbi:MAG TPA: cyclic nucleotide-binding domain-containing protein [Candidatus Limnocylindria bacterium]|nr:cyclic nucleotide-binding domain-containing protein [Candidatus Limnocylindria bacterium]